MKDERVIFFRKALDGLIESLEATVRVTAWSGEESIPEPLKESASQLITRLGTADRLASDTFNGSATDTARVSAMCAAMRRLDAAYVTYRQRLTTPAERSAAALALDSELEEVKASVQR
jgi:hypothetical protein